MFCLVSPSINEELSFFSYFENGITGFIFSEGRINRYAELIPI